MSEKVLIREPVYIIIPVHNRKKTTLTCLEHLQKIGDTQRYHIVIVDDASTDGSKEAINTSYPEVTILPGDGNLWWTGAMVVGMEYAWKQGAEYVFWLNDDCLPAPNSLQKMIEYMQTHSGTIVAPACYDAESNSSIPVANGFRGRKTFSANPGQIIPVDGTSGWCVGIPVSVINKIGLPDAAKFPHYAGDEMYLLKANRAGFKVCILGDAKAELFGGVRVTFNFQRYFQAGSTPVQTFQKLFQNKKSPYRLLTQLFRYQAKYGTLAGFPLFSLKFFLWLGKWLRYQFFSFV